jgi:hypothetical protein
MNDGAADFLVKNSPSLQKNFQARDQSTVNVSELFHQGAMAGVQG